MSVPLASRLRGSVLGLLSGDALGVPVEGMGRDEFEPVTGMRGGGSHAQPLGTWSDAGSLTLTTIESLCEKGGTLDEADLGDRFLRWLFNRHWTARRVTFKVGFTTREAIVAIREGQAKQAREGVTADSPSGKPPIASGQKDEDSNGNGSLLRTAPFAFLAHAKKLDTKATCDLVHRASRITHAHPRAQLVCGLYALLLRGVLDGKPLREAIDFMRAQAGEVYASEPWNSEYAHVQALMEREWRFVERPDVKSSGYSVHTFEAALWATLTKPTLREAVLEAVNLGDDADSVAAVAGSIAGALHGADQVPEEWRSSLARIEEIEPLVARFATLLES